MKITKEILEAHLNCKFKGHLKLAGEVGTRSDYETMTTAARAASREQALAKLVARSGEEATCAGTTVTLAMLRSGPPLLVDVKLEDESLSLRFDALKRAPGPSRLGDHHFLPVLHDPGEKVGRQQKVLLAVLGIALARVQGGAAYSRADRPRPGCQAREGSTGLEALPTSRARHRGTGATPGRGRAAATHAERPLPALRVPAEVPRAGG